jgi:hypothetical protein
MTGSFALAPDEYQVAVHGSLAFRASGESRLKRGVAPAQRFVRRCFRKRNFDRRLGFEEAGRGAMTLSFFFDRLPN